jgi:proteic killer suppression protein
LTAQHCAAATPARPDRRAFASLISRKGGSWAVTVRANWRVIFRFADGDAFDVDDLDCH